MDDEVTEILKKWNLSNPAPKKDFAHNNVLHQHENFDSRTFTRPKRRIFSSNDQTQCISTPETDSESAESGVSTSYIHSSICITQTSQFVVDRVDKFACGWCNVFIDAVVNAAKLAERCVSSQLDLHIYGLPEYRQYAEQSYHQQ